MTDRELQQVQNAEQTDSGDLPPPASAGLLDPASQQNAGFLPGTPVRSKARATGAGVVTDENDIKDLIKQRNLLTKQIDELKKNKEDETEIRRTIQAWNDLTKKINELVKKKGRGRGGGRGGRGGGRGGRGGGRGGRGGGRGGRGGGRGGRGGGKRGCGGGGRGRDVGQHGQGGFNWDNYDNSFSSCNFTNNYY